MRLSRPLRRGFTLVEILTVMAIIALLMGLLVPSFTAVRRFARDTRQRAEFASIEAALTTFRNDHGDYPPSARTIVAGENLDNGGAQILTEALLGRDLLGFHPQSDWRLDDDVYDPDINVNTLNERRGRYLDMTYMNAFRLGISGPRLIDGLFDFNRLRLALAPGTYVLCDRFSTETRVMLADGSVVRAGSPILYYHANRAGRAIDQIYIHNDNVDFIEARDGTENNRNGDHPLGDPSFFYNYITDPRVTEAIYPHRPDSFLLISAGADSLYGTADDIRNF